MFYQDKLQAEEDPNEISCFVYKSVHPNFPKHCHNHLELIYILDGKIKISLDGKMNVCCKDDLIFVPMLTPHSFSYVNNESSTHIILQLGLNFLEDIHNIHAERRMLNYGKRLQEEVACNINANSCIGQILSEIKNLCTVNTQVETVFRREYTYKKNEITEVWRLKGLIFQLFSALVENKIIIYSEETDVSRNIRELAQIQPVLNLMIDHPEENLSMEEAAKISNMSYYNFSRTFKRLLGDSFVDYKNLLRIRQAEELLYETDKSVTEIAELVSFGSLSYFNRTFKKYREITPSEYRKKHIEQNKTKIKQNE